MKCGCRGSAVIGTVTARRLWVLLPPLVFLCGGLHVGFSPSYLLPQSGVHVNVFSGLTGKMAEMSNVNCLSLRHRDETGHLFWMISCRDGHQKYGTLSAGETVMGNGRADGGMDRCLKCEYLHGWMFVSLCDPEINHQLVQGQNWTLALNNRNRLQHLSDPGWMDGWKFIHLANLSNNQSVCKFAIAAFPSQFFAR